MRLSATLAGLLLAAANPLAATTVKGVIFENEMGGAPLKDIRVSAIGADSVSVSLPDGSFVLELPNKQPGETVQLFVPKPWVVVNYFESRFKLSKDANPEPKILLLCQENERQEMVRRYYRLDRFDPIEQSYRNKLKDLQAKNQATEAAKEQLRIERDREREAELHAAEELARVKVQEASEFYTHPTPYYRSDAAMALNSLGVMYRRQNRIKDARRAFDQALEITDKLEKIDRATYLSDEEETLNNLGNMLSDQNPNQDAQDVYDKALEIDCELVKQQRGTYLPSLASTLNNLGTLFHKVNKFEDARNKFSKALTCYKELEDRNSATYWLRVVETLNNLGRLYQDHNQLRDAQIVFGNALNRALARENSGQYAQEIESLYGHVLETSRKLADQKPTIYQREVASTLNDLGTFLRGQNRTKEARQYYDEALKIYRELAQKNLGTYLPYVAKTLNKIDDLNLGQNRMEETRIAFFESLAVEGLAICETLARGKLEKYEPEVQSTYDSLEISGKLAQEGPAIYLRKISDMLINLGMLTRDLNLRPDLTIRPEDRQKEARRAFSKALDIDKATPETNPELYAKRIDSTQRLMDELNDRQQARTATYAIVKEVTVKLVIVLQSGICKGRSYKADNDECPITDGTVKVLEGTKNSISHAYKLSKGESIALLLDKEFRTQLSVAIDEKIYAVLLEFDWGVKGVYLVDMVRDSIELLPGKLKPRYRVNGRSWYTHQNAVYFEPVQGVKWKLIINDAWYGFYVK